MRGAIMIRILVVFLALFPSMALAQSSPAPNFKSLRININPAAEAPAYTTGNTADVTVSNSQYGSLSALWSILDGGTQHDGLSAITRAVPTTTVTQVDGLAGYCDNANPNNMTSGVGVCGAVGAFGINRVDGAQSWLFDGILVDTGTSGPLGRLMQSELDYKPQFANTQVNGLISTMDGPVQPYVADAFIAGSTFNNTTKLGRWQNGFRTYPAQVITAFLADMSQPVGTVSANSQPIIWQASDAAGAVRQIRLTAEGSAGALVLDRADGAALNLVIANGRVNTASVLLTPGYAVASLPTCNAGSVGTLTMVTNNTASPAYGSAPTAGGSTPVLVFCNGAAWTVH